LGWITNDIAVSWKDELLNLSDIEF
jgi:hypothetical protein